MDPAHKSYQLGPQIEKLGPSDQVVLRFKDVVSRRIPAADTRLPPERELPTLRQARKPPQILGVILRHGDASYRTESASNILNEPIEFARALKSISRKDVRNPPEPGVATGQPGGGGSGDNG